MRSFLVFASKPALVDRRMRSAGRRVRSHFVADLKPDLRTIFMDAIDWDSEAERLEYRDQLCGGQAAEVPGSADDGVADWSAQLPQADEQTYEKLFNTFFPRLVALARLHLHGAHRRVADEEDIALGTMEIFFRGLDDGRFELADQDESWQIGRSCCSADDS
jgi:hypothetical protein